ncbi:MAG: metallophosphoesterase family protein [Candidatus Krumholzibacteria bacterium]|nr:metallophosphoesterase family protein [Candidatus Krumholzibacteria bacterium]
MKVLVCSDVHGNSRALRAVLEIYRREGPCDVLSLGDVIGYGAHPDMCLDAVCGLPCVHLVMGNHEAALLDARERSGLNGFAAEAIDWTERMLAPKYVDAVRRRFSMQCESAHYLAVHGSPSHPEEWGYMFSTFDAEQAFQAREFAVCFVGHTHIGALYAFGEGRVPFEDGASVHLEQGKRYIVNPGSVGQPRDGDARASCCVFDTDAATIELHRCTYDVEAEARDIFDAALPRYLGERLLIGA